MTIKEKKDSSATDAVKVHTETKNVAVSGTTVTFTVPESTTKTAPVGNLYIGFKWYKAADSRTPLSSQNMFVCEKSVINTVIIP